MENKTVTFEEACVRLKDVRTFLKDLKAEEDELKKIILADGRKELKTDTLKMSIQHRVREKFNETAFLNDFMSNTQFSDEVKNEVTFQELKLNTEKLEANIKLEKIPLDYVSKFNELTESDVIVIK